jgi:hypothetical protein
MSDIQPVTRRGRKPKDVAPEGQEGNATEAPAKPNETKAEKFNRLAPPRVSNVLYHLKNVSKLGGAGYEWEPAQKAAMFAAIRRATDEAEAAFKPKGETAGKPAFTFG